MTSWVFGKQMTKPRQSSMVIARNRHNRRPITATCHPEVSEGSQRWPAARSIRRTQLCASSGNSVNPSIVEDVFDGGDDSFGLGEDDVFELRLVGAEGVHGGDALDWGVELGEELFADAGCDFGAVAEAAHVFVGDNDTMIFAHGRGDGFPVIGRERSEINDLDGYAFALELRGGDLGAVDNGAVGDDADVSAFFDESRFAERNGVVGSGIFGAVIGLAIKMFVLEEHHRIVAANRGAQHAGDVERGRWHDDAQAGAMRKDRFAALAVIDAAAREVAADRNANDGGCFEVSVGTPARDAEFVAKLHHRGPDVVEELNFGDGL